MIEFDLDKVKLEDPYIDIYWPDGRLLARTNNEKLFLSICVTIKENQAEGFYIAMTEDVKKGGNFETWPIRKNGRVIHGPKHLFRIYGTLLRKLI